jgi:hypothetical protein
LIICIHTIIIWFTDTLHGEEVELGFGQESNQAPGDGGEGFAFLGISLDVNRFGELTEGGGVDFDREDGGFVGHFDLLELGARTGPWQEGSLPEYLLGG